jgi:hypothetical protein
MMTRESQIILVSSSAHYFSHNRPNTEARRVRLAAFGNRFFRDPNPSCPNWIWE